MILFFVTVLSVFALQGIELKFFYAVAYALNFILVTILSWFFLREQLSREKVIGILLIAFGVIFFNA